MNLLVKGGTSHICSHPYVQLLRQGYDIVDFAAMQLVALYYLQKPSTEEFQGINLDTRKGHSELDMVKAFEAARGRAVTYQVVARRPGDTAACYANPEAYVRGN